MAQSEQFGMSYFLWPVSHVPIFHHTGTLIRNLECATPVAVANASTPYIHSQGNYQSLLHQRLLLEHWTTPSMAFGPHGVKEIVKLRFCLDLLRKTRMRWENENEIQTLGLSTQTYYLEIFTRKIRDLLSFQATVIYVLY